MRVSERDGDCFSSGGSCTTGVWNAIHTDKSEKNTLWAAVLAVRLLPAKILFVEKCRHWKVLWGLRCHKNIEQILVVQDPLVWQRSIWTCSERRILSILLLEQDIPDRVLVVLDPDIQPTERHGSGYSTNWTARIRIQSRLGGDAVDIERLVGWLVIFILLLHNEQVNVPFHQHDASTLLTLT